MNNNPSGVPHIYAGNPLDRGDQVRRDEEWLSQKAKDPDSKFLPMKDLNVLIANAQSPNSIESLGWLGINQLGQLGIDSEPIFLGSSEGAAHFVIDISNNETAGKGLDNNGIWRFEDARRATESLSVTDSGIVAQARAQVSWHNRNGFCAICGNETFVQRGGQVRKCSKCETEHYPRTDPVVITLVSDGERCLLGQSRGRLSRTNTYSALAGFVDQGESVEEAVAREIMEEAGIQVANVRYHSSQPWPFPFSLMIGCHADAATTEISMDDEEMNDVRWFDRGEVLLALEGKNENLTVPAPIAIAHHLIKSWANSDR
jgi:NAD+ diphosphatase